MSKKQEVDPRVRNYVMSDFSTAEYMKRVEKFLEAEMPCLVGETVIGCVYYGSIREQYKRHLIMDELKHVNKKKCPTCGHCQPGADVIWLKRPKLSPSKYHHPCAKEVELPQTTCAWPIPGQNGKKDMFWMKLRSIVKRYKDKPDVKIVVLYDHLAGKSHFYAGIQVLHN